MLTTLEMYNTLQTTADIPILYQGLSKDAKEVLQLCREKFTKEELEEYRRKDQFSDKCR
jgi:hypothetical protein